MDEDDSQDELINRSSKSKGRRAALWAISDDSDEAGSDEEGESGSGEDEEEEHLDGEDDEDEEDEDEDEEEEEEEDDDAKVDEAACAGTSADVAEVSSDEEAEKCPICLHSFTRQPVATPENCEHYFCLDCILEWSKNANSCPIDRITFKVIYLRTCYGGKVQKVITVQKPAKQCQQDTIDVALEETSCEVCGASDREDRLLLCDGCDAGYHMECLTPPLDAVPVEEWFCPECEANNRQSRGSATEISDTESLPSTTRLASSRPRSHAGHTRAIARTQHSERVRANVNRHRITQARTQELAPTYLIRSTWLDETINAVVAGLNSSVYVRDLTPRSSTSHRRKTGRRRKSRKTSLKSKGTGVRRQKRKKRRTKSRKKLVMKTATTRSRIANNLGIVKDKKSSSLPTVYRPSESTLSSMRADIGAASLSIYGDPFDLDPFTDQEEEEEQAHDASLLEAKRRGISRSAFRSHQPVARPVSLSRRPVNIPQASGVVEPAPVPDLLGSILSGQSMLLMDSSDVIINRDGSLMNNKPATLTSGMNRSSASGDGNLHTSAGLLPSHMDTLGSSEISLNRHFSQSPSGLSPPIGSTASHSETTLHVPHRGNPRLLGSPSHEPNRPNQRLAHQITNARELRQIVSPSPNLPPDSTSKSKSSSHSHSIKAPTKPMWVDVSVLPRIPKKRRESSADDASSRNYHRNNNRNGASSSSSNGYGMPETGINRLAGDKERRHSVDQQHGRSDSQRNRPDGAGTSSGFSSSFSSSSSASHTNHQRHSSSSSSSVSFRISSSGNSWHSRRLNITSLAPSGGSLQEQCKDEEERKRQLHRDKQKLLASRPTTSNNIYDPFNPTESDSDSSDGADECTKAECSSRLKEEFPALKDKALPQRKEGLPQVKVETQSPRSQDKPENAASQTLKQRLKFTKENLKDNKKESRFTDSPIEKQGAPPKTTIKKEPGSDADEAVKHESHSETEDNTQPVQQKQDLIKMTKIKEETVKEEEPAPEPASAPRDNNTLAASSTSPVRSKHKSEIKSETHTKLPSKDLGIREKKTSRKSSQDQRAHSSTPERDCRQGHSESKHHNTNQKEKDKAKGSRRSRSKERRTHRVSDSSQSKSPDGTSKKRRRSRSCSKDRRRSRSRSSSREQSRAKKHKKQTRERNEDKDVKRRSSKDKKRDRSRSKSRSKSRSRSRSRERRRRRSHSKSRSRSRSRSREKRKDDSRHQSSRDKVESHLKEKKRHRSRSSSREKKKERPTTKSQKTIDSYSSSVKDKKTTKDKRKDEEMPNKADKTSKTSKAEPSSSYKSIPQVKKEPKESKIEKKANQVAEKTEKKEKCPLFDIFEDSPNNNRIKKEETDTPCSLVEAKCEEETIKTEICEPEKTEAKSPDILDSTMSEQTMPISTPSHDTPEQSIELATVSVKQEGHLPSDSDDDFNVDAILDNLDLLKSRAEKGIEDAIKQEKEEKNEGETAAVGAKSKTQVKRVTWNIQEPEGPQPDKSASKVALYKLKLKQEGIRRPSSLASTSSQDLTGTASDVNLLKTGGDPHSLSGLGSDSTHPLSVLDADDGDLLKKDKQYLKKLHMQERAIEEVKLAIKPFYQKRDINKEEYKDILRKAVQKVCHSKSGEINPVKVGNLVKAYVDKYKHARKYKKGEESGKTQGLQSESMKASDSP